MQQAEAIRSIPKRYEMPQKASKCFIHTCAPEVRRGVRPLRLELHPPRYDQLEREGKNLTRVFSIQKDPSRP